MRIVIDLQGAQCGSRHRGIGRYSLALALAMVKNRGNNEIIIALNGLFSETIEPIRAAFDGILSQDNIRVWHAVSPVRAFATENNWRRHTAELIREAFLASLQPDVIHITSLMEGFDDDAVHSIGLLNLKIPIIVTFYDLIPLIQKDTYLTPNPLFERLYREKLGYLSKANFYFAISESSRLEVIDHLNVSIDRVSNISAAANDIFKPIDFSNIDEQTIRKKFGLTKRFVMYSGATDERKNLFRLIKAFSMLPYDLIKSYQLVIAGNLPASHREQFELHIQSCGLEIFDVSITGKVTDDEMVILYNLCDLFVLPSYHEGFGLPVLEAMSCGAPVIASNATSLPEVVGRSDVLFDPFDEQSITQKMIDVLNNDLLREDISQHGLKQARKFSWDRSAKQAITNIERWCVKQNHTKASQDTKHLNSLLIERIAKISNSPVNEVDLLATASAISKNS